MVCWQLRPSSCPVAVPVTRVCLSRGLREWARCGRSPAWGGVCVCARTPAITAAGLRGCSLLVFTGGGPVGTHGRESGSHVVRSPLCSGDPRRSCSTAQKPLPMGSGPPDTDPTGRPGSQRTQAGAPHHLTMSRTQALCPGATSHQLWSVQGERGGLLGAWRGEGLLQSREGGAAWGTLVDMDVEVEGRGRCVEWWEEAGAVCESRWEALRGRTRMRLACRRAQE
ncbi:uncharacterized protein LOC106634934 [Pan paniscus]|uniref:uncharacterized protein LOC106634934 n=1 Tax=Pan paniscus TaxID=9597 RepID=UPI00243667C3|nr:uncharacterized protein LOC106634934 [Pan paniscus]